MTGSRRHVVGRQVWDLDVASEALALALQPHVGDVNRRRWLPAIETVLDELDEPGRRIRVDRLELDLGTVPFTRLEEEVEERLVRELRRVLASALRRSSSNDAEPTVRRVSNRAARRELLERELATGTLPYWGRDEAPVPLEDRVVAMMADAPDDLVALVRTLGRRSRRPLERLARQLGDTALAELVRLLEPEHAVLILAYVGDLRRVHRIERLVGRDEREFARVVWILVQAYLVEEPGSQFNRRSFLRGLLERLAGREGLPYAKLLGTLRRGLERLAKRRPVRSSLPAVVAELATEAGLRDDGSEPPEPEEAVDVWQISPASLRLFDRYERWEILCAALCAGPALWSELTAASGEVVSSLLAELPDLPRSRLRSMFSGTEPGLRERILERMARGLPAEALLLWLRRLFPAAADPASPLGSSLERFAAQADDPGVLYAGVILDVLDGGALDLEAAVARRISPERIEPLGDSATWRAVWAALSEIPVPYRPRPENLLREMLAVVGPAVDAGRPWTEEIFGRLLAGLFTWPLPEPVGRFLLRRTRVWADSGPVPAEHAAAFRAALEAAGAEKLETEGEAASAEGGGSTAQRREALRRQDREALLELLRGERRSLDPGVLRRALDALLRESPREVREMLRREGVDEERRAAWIDVLPESALVRVTAVLAPRRHRELLAGAEILASAWIEVQGSGPPTFGDRRVFWSFLLGFLARPDAGEPSVEDLTAAFFEHCADRFRGSSGAPEHAVEVGSAFLEAAARRAHQAGQAVLRAVLLQEREPLLAAWTAETAPGRARPPRSSSSRDGEPGDRPREPRRSRDRGDDAESPDERDDALYVDNAGLVLAGAFLPHLFRALDFLAEDEDGDVAMRDAPTASRAVHLLQWLVDGRTDAPEAHLVLNKLLCGMPLGSAVDRSIEPTEEERQACEKLLASMLANWPSMSGTSMDGLRETFLQREGRLERADDGWRLTVQRKTLDVLLDRAPWSISVIRHRWMPETVYVEW